MKNKKILIIAAGASVIILAVICLLCFTCVFGNHRWKEATCTEPRTCERCGKTEGEPLGHIITEETCTEPSVCTRCGEVFAEALGHDWQGQNYQEGAVCARCGAEGDGPLSADFETYGLDTLCDVIPEEGYSYTTSCWYDENYTTTGTVTYYGYERFTGREGFEDLDGYEWMQISVDLDFADENAWAYGMLWDIRNEDYYNVRLYDDTITLSSDTQDGSKEYSFTVNYYGTDYADCLKKSVCEKSGWSGHAYQVTYHLYYRVPAGYDGILIGAVDTSLAEDHCYVYDLAEGAVTHFFRMQ